MYGSTICYYIIISKNSQPMQSRISILSDEQRGPLVTYSIDGPYYLEMTANKMKYRHIPINFNTVRIHV